MPAFLGADVSLENEDVFLSQRLDRLDIHADDPSLLSRQPGGDLKPSAGSGAEIDHPITRPDQV
ncbi:MAG: hypothetical protein HYU47_13500, partial [Deltaproteobacteria bacterium]|nr:hypothetical protein [Deltaproteobacteria bacterium]